MRADNVTRAPLAPILTCLLLVLACGRDGGGAEAARSLEPRAQRFEVKIVQLRRISPLLVRVDTATGMAWRMGLLNEGRWELLPAAAGGVPSPDGSEPGRYSIEPVRQSRGTPTLVRVDRLSGRVWRKGATNAGPWVLVPNPGDEAPPQGAGQLELPAGETPAAGPEAP